MSNGKSLPTFSKLNPNHIFLDGDNFLWTGSFEMYTRMYGVLLAELADRADDPTFHDLAKEVFLKTLHLSDKERISLWMSAITDRGLPCAFDSEVFVAKTHHYFLNHFKDEIKPVNGASELLRSLSDIRAIGVPLTVHLLSLNMDFALPLIVNHFGWVPYFNGALLGAPFVSLNSRKSKAEQALIQIGAKTDGLVVVAGDSISDIAAGEALSENGFNVLTLAAASGIHSLAELQKARAGVSVHSLNDLLPIFQQLRR